MNHPNESSTPNNSIIDQDKEKDEGNNIVVTPPLISSSSPSSPSSPSTPSTPSSSLTNNHSPLSETLRRTFHHSIESSSHNNSHLIVIMHHLCYQTCKIMFSVCLMLVDILALPMLMTLRIMEAFSSLFTASASSIKDGLAFNARRFEIFLKPFAQECDKCWRIIVKAFSLGIVTMLFPVSLGCSLSSIVLPPQITSAVSEVVEAVDEAWNDVVTKTKTVFNSISNRISELWSSVKNHRTVTPSSLSSSQQSASPHTHISSFSTSPQSEPPSLRRRRLLDNNNDVILTESQSPRGGIRQRVETNKLYQIVDHGATAMEKLLGEKIRGATESVALKVGSLGDAWSRQLIDTRVKNWELRCKEEQKQKQQGELCRGEYSRHRRRSLTFSKAISQPSKASNPALFQSYASLRVSFHQACWRPASQLLQHSEEQVEETQEPQQRGSITEIDESSSKRCKRFSSMNDATPSEINNRTRPARSSTSVFSAAGQSGIGFDSDVVGTRRTFHSGNETPSAWRGGPIRTPTSSSMTPITLSPHRSRTRTQSPLRTMMEPFMSEEKDSSVKEGSESGQSQQQQQQQRQMPEVGAFAPLFPYFTISMNGVPLYRTPPGQISDETRQSDFEWNMSFSLECRHPLDQFSLSLCDYDYVTDNSEIVSILSLPAWRIPRSDHPVEGWLPIWLGPADTTNASSGILWVYLGLQMQLQRVDSELMALLLPPPKSIGSSACHPKHEATSETDLLPTSAESGVYKAAENGMQQFAFRRDKWLSDHSEQKSNKQNSQRSEQTASHGNAVGQLLTSYIRLQRSLWTILASPVLRTCRAVLQWRYPLVSIAALISFWWIWLQPSFILPTSIGLLGLHYLIQYLCIIELWSYFPYPLSTLMKFMLKWSDEDDDDEEDELIRLEESKMNSSISLVSYQHRKSVASLSSYSSSFVTKSEGSESTSSSRPYPQHGYRTKVISRLLPRPLREILWNASVVCDNCAHAIEKANEWSLRRSPSITLGFGVVGLIIGVLFSLLTQDWKTTVPQLVLNGILFLFTTIYVGSCLSVLFMGTFVLVFWSEPVRALLRLLHALHLLWLISRARNDGSLCLLPTMDP